MGSIKCVCSIETTIYLQARPIVSTVIVLRDSHSADVGAPAAGTLTSCSSSPAVTTPAAVEPSGLPLRTIFPVVTPQVT